MRQLAFIAVSEILDLLSIGESEEGLGLSSVPASAESISVLSPPMTKKAHAKASFRRVYGNLELD